MLVLGLVPARGGSKGVPGKNVKPLKYGRNLLDYASWAANKSGVVNRVVLSTESTKIAGAGRRAGLEVLTRPAALAADDTPMLPVIEHALAELARTGWSPEIVVLLQPTSPLRRPDHIRNALAKLRKTRADSVVTVVRLPLDSSPDYVMRIEGGRLQPFLPEGALLTRRQDTRPAYRREGTVYAFWRATLERFGNIYGDNCQPLVLDPCESLSIDTPADWDDAKRRAPRIRMV